ncbi:MAG: hypothetical protein ACRC6B_01760, partial [Fusobacteriaceae bacterium]
SPTVANNKLTFNGNIVYNAGNKPTATDVGLPNVKDVSLNWAWGTANPTHIWGSQGDSKQSYVYNGSQLKTFVGLDAVNNWGASSAVDSTSTTTYATAAAVKIAYDKALEAISTGEGSTGAIQSITITGTGSLTGGGDLTANREITHLTTAGHKHIPSGGAANQYLKYSADGTAVWSSIPAGAGSYTLTRGNYLTGGNYNGTAAQTWAVDATDVNTAGKVVARNSSGNFSAGTITASLSGNATTATKWSSARTITIGNSTKIFDGTGNVTFAGSEIGGTGGSQVWNAIVKKGTWSIICRVANINFGNNVDVAIQYTRHNVIVNDVIKVICGQVKYLEVSGGGYTKNKYRLTGGPNDYNLEVFDQGEDAVGTTQTARCSANNVNTNLTIYTVFTAGDAANTDQGTGTMIKGKVLMADFKSLGTTYTSGEFYAQNDKRVYHTGYKPNSVDVGLGNVPNTVHTTAATINTVA